MKKVEGKNGGTLNAMEKGETLNPNGRPKKSFALLNETLKKEGYEAVTKTQFIEAYTLLFSLDETKISEIAEDETQPLAIRLIIAELTETQSRGKTIQNMVDYMFGKAKEEVKHDIDANVKFSDLVKVSL